MGACLASPTMPHQDSGPTTHVGGLLLVASADVHRYRLSVPARATIEAHDPFFIFTISPIGVRLGLLILKRDTVNGKTHDRTLKTSRLGSISHFQIPMALVMEKPICCTSRNQWPKP